MVFTGWTLLLHHCKAEKSWNHPKSGIICTKNRNFKSQGSFLWASLMAQTVKSSACNVGDPGSILSSLWKKFLWTCRAPETLSKKLSVPSPVWSCFFGVGSSTAICHWWSFFFSFGEQEGEDTAWVKQRTKKEVSKYFVISLQTGRIWNYKKCKSKTIKLVTSVDIILLSLFFMRI